MGLVAFIADGSVLPRESGISQKPLRNCVKFQSPDTYRVSFELPHQGMITGMGIPKGITPDRWWWISWKIDVIKGNWNLVFTIMSKGMVVNLSLLIQLP